MEPKLPRVAATTLASRERRQRWMAWALSLVVPLGCGAFAGGSRGGTNNEPIIVKEPPEPPEGSTVAGCEGISDTGTCEGTSRLFCDLERAALRSEDCAGTGNDCVMDPDWGASCAQVPAPLPAGGTCDGTTAYWQSDIGMLHRWDCAPSGKSCVIDGCAEGVFCCDDAAPEPECCDPLDPACAEPCPTVPEPENICDTIPPGGLCSPDNSEVVFACVQGGTEPSIFGCPTGQSCAIGQCSEADVAACCPADADPEPPQTRCDELGYAGDCIDGVVMWCENATIEEAECSEGFVCHENGCLYGACCIPIEEDPEPTCESVNGADGICDGDVLLYCDNDAVTTIDCEATDDHCAVNTCLISGAACC